MTVRRRRPRPRRLPTDRRSRPARAARRQHGVSIRDVARLAGVSAGTASRVLSGSTYPVSDRARRRVEEAARALNYVTNSAARALVTGRSEIVGAIVHDITDPFFSVVVRGLQDAAVADGLVVLVGNDDRDAGKLEGYLTMLLSQKPTGVVLIGGQLRDPAATLPVALAVQRLCEQGVPVVAVGRYELDIPHVAVDDVAAAACAVEHLVALGHRRIAFSGGPLNSTTVQDRYSGYSAALMRVGEPLDERLVVQTPLTLEGGAQAIGRLVAGGAPFTAVFAATDEVAFGAMSALREHGLRYRATSAWWASTTSSCRRTATRRSPRSTCRPASSAGGLAAAQGRRSGVAPRGQRVPVDLVARGSTDRRPDVPAAGERRPASGAATPATR